MATAPTDYAASTPDDYANYDSGDPARPQDGEVLGRRSGLLGVAENRLYSLVDDGRSELVKSLDALVALAQDLAGKVGTSGSNPVAGYAHQAVSAITDVRDALRDRPVEALVDEGRAIVRRQPEIAVGVAVAVGFLAARLVKASR
ncbi:hypothetical protein IP88_15535 [alpha proteobacterium AAP81b]|nr:hypothetical protein IP88_15535 [alpha proteobacterium AAP81b]